MVREIVHGTNTGYSYKCRCDLCKQAHANANLKTNRVNNSKYNQKLKKEKSISPEVILAASIQSEPIWRFHGFGPVKSTLIKH